VAAELLLDLPSTTARITKLMPRHYATVLTTRAEAIAEGLDPDGEAVWSRILEATRG
jgi:glutamate synthase (NADPH/NADH) large chain